MTTPSSRGDLGDEIRRRRKAAKMTQKDLAKLAAVATTNVGRIERGAPVSPTTMRAVARALDLPAEMVRPFLSGDALSESPSSTAPGPEASGTVSNSSETEERELVLLLIERGWSNEDIRRAIDTLRKRRGGIQTVEPRTATDL